MLHIRNRALRGASAISAVAALSAARSVPANIERKDGADSMTLEIKKGFEDFSKAFEAFQTKNDDRIKQLEGRGEDAVTKAELKALNDALTELKTNTNEAVLELKRSRRSETGDDKRTPEQKAYSAAFESYLREGVGETKGTAEYKSLREMELKAMSTLVDTDGGFTARPEMDNAIDSTVKLVSPIRALATVRKIGAKNYKKLVNVHGTASGWVGETDSRPQTQGPQLKELDFPAMELYAMPAATSDLLDDAFISIDQWLADEVALEFARAEGAAFVNGNSVKQPQGFLAVSTVANASYAWGSTGYIASGASGDYDATVKADCLVNLYHALRPAYRINATWGMNNNMLSKTRQLKDGQGNYLIMRSFGDDGIVERMMGKPVEEIPDMPDPAANSLSVAFADFKRWYLIVDRVGTRVFRDPFTSKPYVLFYTTKRVGGGIQNFEAGKVLKLAVS